MNIIWTEDAAEELIDIILYQKMKYGKEKAHKVYGTIQNRITSIINFPHKGRLVPELSSLGITSYHEIIEPPWRLIYRVTTDGIYIISLIDSRRNVEELLYKKLIDGKL